MPEMDPALKQIAVSLGSRLDKNKPKHEQQWAGIVIN